MNRMLAFLGIALVAVFAIFWLLPDSKAPAPTPAAAPATVTASAIAHPARHEPSFAPSTETTGSTNAAATNLFARLMAGDFPKLTREQIDAYLLENRRSAESLLAAFRLSGDKTLLKEAAEGFPNDPRVAFAGAFKSDSPEERAHWLDLFRQTAPNNAMPDFLAAADAFKAGKSDLAAQAVAAAAAKPNFEDYSLDFIQASQEAYRSAGYSEAESKAIAGAQLELPQLAQLKSVGVGLAEMAKSYQEAGNTSAAQSALQMASLLGQRLEDAPGFHTLIGDLVGQAIERVALGAMDPTSAYGDSGQTVQQRMDDLKNQRDTIRSAVRGSEQVVQSLSEQDLSTFLDRRREFGELAALKWARNRIGQPPSPAGTAP